MKKTEKEKELESSVEMHQTCSKLYHEELVKSRMAFDVLVRNVSPSIMSDLLAELYELRQEKDERDKNSKKKSNR